MSKLDAINCFICQIMSGWPQILFQSAKPQIRCYSIRLASQKMSEPFKIIFKCSNVQIRCNKLFYMPNNVWMAPKYYLNLINPESDVIQPDWNSRKCLNHST